ncbi:hypothetical protein C0J52_24097, partial [Blattella germanica]
SINQSIKLYIFNPIYSSCLFQKLLLLVTSLVLGVHAGYIPPGPRYHCPEKPLLLFPCICEAGTDAGLLVRCENSNLASLSIGLANLATLHTPVEQLTFSKCHIKRLYGSLLYPLRVRVLKFEETPLQHIEEHTFLGINRTMQELHIIGSELQEFPKLAFQTLGNLSVLEIDGHEFKSLPGDAFSSGLLPTRLERLHIANGLLSELPADVIDVSGNQVTEIQKLAFKDLYLVTINLSHNAIEKIESGSFENCANITLLNLSHNKLKKIPQSAFDATTYATELDLSYNELTDLSQVPLHNMTGLKILNVSYNQIEKIPRNTFPKLYELHTVDVSHNQVRDIWNSVFQSLFSLRFLNLSHNALKTVKGSTFGALHTLLELDLSNNEMNDVNRAALARCASLRMLSLRNNSLSKIFQLPISLSHLDLSENSISHIEPLETWPTMNSLLSLDLSYNSLGDSLERGAFSNLLTLQRLNLEGNGLTKAPWESLEELSTLQFLNLKHNSLTKLERGAFGRLPVVFDLNLAHNNLNNITSRAFEGLLQLLTLNLTSNNLTYIPNGAFQGLVSLRTLDLSHNYLEKLDNKTHGLLDDCLSLERVNLSHNKISFITRQTFPSSPWVPYRLREVDLSHNVMPVLTYDITIGTRKLELLNISNNILNEIHPILDLSHNELTELPARVFRPPKNLSSLYLQGNLLPMLPLEQLLSMKPTLRLLDIRDNKLQHFHHELMPLIENGTKILYSGNPLLCDCETRPLRQWLSTQVTPEPEWNDLKCVTPQFLQGHALVNVSEDRLACTSEREGPHFDINPDLKFRDVHKTNDGGMSVSWYVTTSSDVADFRLIAREQEQVVLEHDVPYSVRTHVLKKIPAHPQLELCLLARDSAGNVRHWHSSQCTMLSTGKSYSDASIPYLSTACFIFAAVVYIIAR